MATVNSLLRLLLVFALLARSWGGGVALADEMVISDYDIPSGPLDQGLIEFARQTRGMKLSVLIPSADYARATTNALQGRYRPDEALSVLLLYTGLKGSIGQSGIVAVTNIGDQSMVSKPSRGRWMGSLLGFIGAHLFAPISSAQVEPAAQPADDSASTLQEVVVTGTRLGANFSSPTPVTTVSADQLAQAAPTDIATALAQLPALTGSVLSTQPASASAGAGTNGQSLLNLRALGVNRSLVLLDGQRLGTTNVQDSVDINMIPQSLLKRVDIVTGGASASYGSDAVAGVVNFILDSKFQGFKAEVSAGQTTYHDAGNGTLQLAYGRALGDNGRLIVGGNLFKESGIGLNPSGRNWHDNPYVAYPNPTAGALPSTIVVPNGRADNATFGGLITGVNGCSTVACRALVNQQFGDGGALQPFQQGDFSNGVNGGFASGGQGATVGYGVSPTIDRENALLHAEWDVKSNLTLFTEAILARTATSLDGQWPSITGTTQFTIFPNNAFLPTAVKQFFTANPTATSISVGRSMSDLGPQQVRSTEKVGRFSFGAKGNINDRWSFDSSIAEQYSEFDLDVYIQIERNLYASANSVVSPTTGQPVCASTLLGLDPGCVPMNLFGPNAVSAEAKNYINGLNRGDTVFRQTALESNLRGDLGDNFTLGAGPISVATGFAYRRDLANRKVDALSNTNISCTGVAGCPAALSGRYGAYYFYNPTPFHGTTSATEGYAEAGVPLLKDLPGVKSLSVDLAGRLTDYSVSGVQDTWKLGLQWTVNDSLRVRGAFSQDSRAPDVIELFNPGSATLSSNLFPSSTATPRAQVGGLNISKGNINLQPEIAHTLTAGLVVSPSAIEGLQASIDYYKIDIAHAIQQLTAQGVVDGCSNGIATYCNLVTLNGVPITGTGGIVASTTGLVVTVPADNVGNVSIAGLDFESDYTRHLWGGSVTGRLVANYLLKVNQPTAVTGCAFTDILGAVGGCLGASGYPRWKGSVSGQYERGRAGIFIQERVIDSAKADPWSVVGVTITRNAIPMIEYTDLNFSYAVGFADRGKAYLQVSNLFNRNPPVTITRASGSIPPPAANVYDLLGRRFVVGYKFTF